MIFLQTLNTAENQLPAIIFTQPEDKRKTMPVITDLGKLPMISPFPPPKLNLQGLNLPVPKELPKAEDGMKKEAVKKRRGKTRLDFTALFNGRKQREAGQKSRVPLPRRKGVWKIQAAKRSR